MYEEMNGQLEQLRQGIARLRKTEVMLRQLETEQDMLERKERELQEILQKENQDALRLEHTSLQRLFYTLLGSLEERQDKERREALAAKLKYDQAARDLADVRARILSLMTERAACRACPQDYDVLLQRKQEAMQCENSETAQKLCTLSEQIGFERLRVRELHEAATAGRAVQESLRRAQKSLNSAEDWGAWDMFGGGAISGSIKHSHIDDAKAEIERTQYLLRTFHSELADVQIQGEMCIDISDFGRFADIFFDGLLVDWYMQDKISESQRSVERVQEQVENVMYRLEQLERDETERLQAHETALRALVEQAS